MFRITVECLTTEEIEHFCFDNIHVKYQGKPGKRTMLVAELCAYDGFTAATPADAQYACEAECARKEREEWAADGYDEDDPEGPEDD